MDGQGPPTSPGHPREEGWLSCTWPLPGCPGVPPELAAVLLLKVVTWNRSIPGPDTERRPAFTSRVHSAGTCEWHVHRGQLQQKAQLRDAGAGGAVAATELAFLTKQNRHEHSGPGAAVTRTADPCPAGLLPGSGRCGAERPASWAGPHRGAEAVISFCSEKQEMRGELGAQQCQWPRENPGLSTVTTGSLEPLRPVTSGLRGSSEPVVTPDMPVAISSPGCPCLFRTSSPTCGQSRVHVMAAGEGQLSGQSCRSPPTAPAPGPAPFLTLPWVWKEEAVAGTAVCPLTAAGGSTKAHADRPPRPGAGEPRAWPGGLCRALAWLHGSPGRPWVRASERETPLRGSTINYLQV